MKYTKHFFFMTLFLSVLTGCDLSGTSENGDSSNPLSYYSKEVEYSTYIDGILEPVESRIYDSTGALNVIFNYFYSDPDSLGYPVNDFTEVYVVDDTGTASLIESYKYYYQIDDYEYTDDDGITQTVSDYIINRGETYDKDNNLILYYDVTYEVWPLAYDQYTSIVDRNADTGDIIARQNSTYITDGGGDERYRTEKFYNLSDPDDPATLSLTKEFACWYDIAAPYNYLYELYHSVRSSDGSDEFYYLTRYSRNDNGDVYEQEDWDYDSSLVPKDADGSYTVTPADPEPFVYDITFPEIGAKATVLNTDYDSLGNIIEDRRYLDGQLIEYTTYSYNEDSELIDQSRYTQGGTLLYDRISIQFKEEYRDGVYYRIKEASTFKYYDEPAERNSGPDTRELAASDSSIIKPPVYRKTLNNHHR